ncbi:hypothetical protein [uncultured Sphingomonas sp.]|uniref:hypothetical protein n=1 Tax=uncultured Sphingomonas sp. TaxID=158754 RepID=UPI0025F34052|nr:hypothetical protein [uncultured Sphingomonas sp.]
MSFNFTNRDHGELLLEEIDLASQLAAVRGLIRRQQQADEELQKEVADIREAAMKASGRYQMHLENTWVDNMHAGVFQDAAHSMSALGMLAPLMETLMTAIFHAIGREKLVTAADLKEPRLGLAPKELWDPHIVAGISRNGKRKGELIRSTDILRGTVQLAVATGFALHLPANWQIRMEALFRYRNKMFHNGFEWPLAERVKFAKDVAEWPAGWFVKSERGTSKGPSNHGSST